MLPHEGKYNIKAVSKMLGIQPGTLRAWERRYQMIAPVRNESGHRLYSEEHVQTLKWLSDKVNKGFTISQAVALLESGKSQPVPQQSVVTAEPEQSDVMMEQLLRALLRFDENQAHEIMDKAFSIYTIDKVVIEILGTLLIKIGDMWEAREITSAHEHFASAFLRSRIGMMLHSLPMNGLLPRVIAVCGPGEWHELGLLIFTLYLRRRGFDVIYLGASIAEGDLQIILREVKAKFLFMSCTLAENIDATLELVEELAQQFPQLHVGLGGKAFDRMSVRARQLHEAVILGQTKEQWDEWLKQRLAQVE